MKLIVGRYALAIQSEDGQDCAFIEDTLKLKEEGDFIYCIKDCDAKATRNYGVLGVSSDKMWVQTDSQITITTKDKVISKLNHKVKVYKEVIKDWENRFNVACEQRDNYEEQYETLKQFIKNQPCTFWQKIRQLWH